MCPGDVVIELTAPDDSAKKATSRSLAGASEVEAEAHAWVQVRLLVAARARREPERSLCPRWLWLGWWPRVGANWPYLVVPLAMIVTEQERRAACER